MPTYNYLCKNCRHEFQEFHGINDLKEICPECGGELKKTYKDGNAPGINFKGPNFYSNS